jgi:hypothetical protein
MDAGRLGGLLSSRVLAVLGQVIGVVALGVIVYVAFLRPGDTMPLEGVDVDPGIRAEAPREAPRGQLVRERPRRRQHQRGNAQVTATVQVVPTAGAPAGPPYVGPDSGETPVGSQYADSVARVLELVSQGRD